MPAGSGGPYVAAAYVVFLALIFVYVVVIGARAARLERDLAALTEALDKKDASS